MTYRVVFTDNAKSNLRDYYLRATEKAPQTAAIWLDRFENALQCLNQQPFRCPLAPENHMMQAEIRQIQFGKRTGCYRVLFTITGDEVRVLHIRRAAMDIASPDDFDSSQ